MSLNLNIFGIIAIVYLLSTVLAKLGKRQLVLTQKKRRVGFHIWSIINKGVHHCIYWCSSALTSCLHATTAEWGSNATN